MPNSRVIIVGAGFAGLAAARQLANTDAEILLIDRSNHHTFQPLLYQVATAALSPADIAAPVRRIFTSQKNTRVLMAEITGIDPVAKTVTGRTPWDNQRTVGYDYLVLAAGKVSSYFGNPQWERHAPGLKCVEDAVAIRRRVLGAFEHAETAENDTVRRNALTFVVVGGGPTGVEMAGSLAEIATRVVRKDFRSFDPADAKVILVEGAGAILPGFPDPAGDDALRQLRSLGVEVRLGTMVKDIDAKGVTLADGDRIDADTVVWGAGVRASPIADTLSTRDDVESTRDGRLVVNPDLSIPAHPDIFVIGDIASVKDRARQGNKPADVPGVAPAAIQMGKHAGRTIARLIANPARKERPAFAYTDKGTLATIGRHRATGRIFGTHVSGYPAWLLWAMVHILFLVSFRNRILVMLQWIWNYFTFGRGARLITQTDQPTDLQQAGKPTGNSSTGNAT